MPNAKSIDTAEAVKEALNGESFSQSFTAVRNYADWDWPMEDASGIRVDVVPMMTGQTVDLVAQGRLEHTIPIDIGIRKKFDPTTDYESDGSVKNSAVDPLVRLVEELHEFLTPDRLSSFDTAIWDRSEILAAPIKEHLRKMKQFTGVLRIYFKADTVL